MNKGSRGEAGSRGWDKLEPEPRKRPDPYPEVAWPAKRQRTGRGMNRRQRSGIVHAIITARWRHYTLIAGPPQLLRLSGYPATECDTRKCRRMARPAHLTAAVQFRKVLL
uniref:Uncharacterized protein n=1 Tax=Pristionchus pacificus TaxID=54126 RepID=A0A2A6B5F7_PRIPA|eukprot:PDM61112.1 hypothetical protein PRIPAC_54918 [Pristionchus pacificus]